MEPMHKAIARQQGPAWRCLRWGSTEMVGFDSIAFRSIAVRSALYIHCGCQKGNGVLDDAPAAAAAVAETTTILLLMGVMIMMVVVMMMMMTPIRKVSAAPWKCRCRWRHQQVCRRE